MSSCDNESEHIPFKNKRKKGSKEVLYKCEKIKKARLKNEEYVNYKGNVTHPNNHGFDCRCKWKCIPTKISEDVSLRMYAKFLDFGSKNEQDIYLQALIECLPVARKRRKSNASDGDELGSTSKPKQHTFKYTLSTAQGKIEVCNRAFLSVHGIKPDRVRRLCLLLVQDKVPKDMRGKNLSGNAKPGHVVKAIVDHISTFPQKEAHYTSKSYYYLSANLNVKIMCNLFYEKHPQLKDQVDYKYYLKIFHENFHYLSFGRPQVDTCCKCEELSVKIKSPSLNETAKRVYVAEHLVHKQRAKKFYLQIQKVKDMCLKDNTVGGICMDYMQNLQLPHIPVQETFYLRQLSVNVFDIHNLADNKAMFYVYYEGLAKKGPNEVCSFLLNYFDNVLDKNVKHLHVFSDGTDGQNKNNTVIRMFLALVEIGRFYSVHHYFPIRGHSYLPCDRDFSAVKRKIKKTDRVYTVKEYVELITMSTTDVRKFGVTMVNPSDVKDFKSWWPNLYKKDVVSTETQSRNIPRDKKQHFSVSQYMEFIYSKEHIGEVKAKSFIGGLQTQTFDLKRTTETPQLPNSRVYPNDKLPINKLKIEDLKKFKNYIPEEYMDELYNEVFTWPAKDNEEPEILD